MIERAREILRRHEQSEEKLSHELSPGASPDGAGALPQQTSFTAIDESVLEAIRRAELDALTPLEALTMYAYDAARFGHAETHTGALRAGYDADFVVLDRDPFADGAFARTRVLQTWSDGACVFAVSA